MAKNDRFGDRLRLRPLHILLVILLLLTLVIAGLSAYGLSASARQRQHAVLWDTATAGLGLTDLSIATEARYTRHPSVTDPLSPFMEHPGAIEHFPTGSFWAPPDLAAGLRE